LLALRTAVVFDPLAVDVELTIAADGQPIARQFIVGHFQRRAVPPQTAPDGSLAPIDIEGATAPSRQPIACEVGRIHFDRVATAEPQSAANRHIDRAAAPDDETAARDLIVGDFER
jgi:hypothetical protein